MYKLFQVTSIPEEHILVAMFPGLPTSAELFILPPKNVSERRKGSKADLEHVSKSTENLFFCCPIYFFI